MASAASHGGPRDTQAAIARRLQVSRQAINELVQRGILELGRDGKLDVELARQAIAARVRPSAKTARALAGAAANETAAPPAGEPAPEPPEAANATSYHVAKTLREAAEAKMAQLRLRERQGELVEAEAVRRQAFELARGARDLLWAMPPRLAALLAAESDPAKCQALLEAEVRQVCTEIAKLGHLEGA